MKRQILITIAAVLSVILLGLSIKAKYSPITVEKIQKYRIEAEDFESFKDGMVKKGFTWENRKENLNGGADDAIVPFELNVFTKNKDKYLHYEIRKDSLKKIQEYSLRFSFDTISTTPPELIHSKNISLRVEWIFLNMAVIITLK